MQLTATVSLIPFRLVEVSFPAWPPPVAVARAIAPAAPQPWATHAGIAVEGLVFCAWLLAVPAGAAILAALVVVALACLSLLAPVLAAAAVWLTWRSDLPPRRPTALTVVRGGLLAEREA
jgi:hypothetical protein